MILMPPKIILKDDEGEGEVVRIRPDVLQTALLDDMIYKLGSLELVLVDIRTTLSESFKNLEDKVDKINTFLEDTSYEGRTKTVSKTITGNDGNVKIPITEKWYEYTIFNDGPDDVYVESSEKSRGDTSINMGDQITVKSKRGSSKPVYARADSGDTATVRVVYKM